MINSVDIVNRRFWQQSRMLLRLASTKSNVASILLLMLKGLNATAVSVPKCSSIRSATVVSAELC